MAMEQKSKTAKKFRKISNTIHGLLRLPLAVGFVTGIIILGVQSSRYAGGVVSIVESIVEALDGTIFVALLVMLAVLVVIVALWADYKLHKNPLVTEDPTVEYSLMHHMQIAVIPQLNYYKKNLAGVVISGTLAIFVCAVAVGFSISRYTTASNAKEFVTTWKTDNQGASKNNQIIIPVAPGEEYNFTIKWGDGKVDTNVRQAITHTYASAGIYEVRISGSFPRMYLANTGDKNKLIAINQWGAQQWSSMQQAFMGATNLVIVDKEVPDLSQAKNMASMFQDATGFNSAIDHWNVSTITTMDSMFQNAVNFNSPLESWDTSNVKSMRNMFLGASKFNQPIGAWNIAKTQDIYGMFIGAASFSQSLEQWNTANIVTMTAAFYDAEAFNASLGEWNMSNVRNAKDVFSKNHGLSSENYDKTLEGWSKQQLRKDVAIGMGFSKYCSSAQIRTEIMNSFGWILTDGGKAENCSIQ